VAQLKALSSLIRHWPS